MSIVLARNDRLLGDLSQYGPLHHPTSIRFGSCNGYPYRAQRRRNLSIFRRHSASARDRAQTPIVRPNGTFGRGSARCHPNLLNGFTASRQVPALQRACTCMNRRSHEHLLQRRGETSDKTVIGLSRLMTLRQQVDKVARNGLRCGPFAATATDLSHPFELVMSSSESRRVQDGPSS